METVSKLPMERAFSPWSWRLHGVLGRCPRLVWDRAFGPINLMLCGSLSAEGRCPRLVWDRAFGPINLMLCGSLSAEGRCPGWYGIGPSAL
jgi:hypothetical protein